MRDARDAEDALLLQTGDHATLIAAWYPVIQQRCLARAGDAGWDVAHEVVERLLAELQRGRTYAVPYRVVVHNVVTWTIKEHWQGTTDGRSVARRLGSPRRPKTATCASSRISIWTRSSAS